MKVIFYIVYLTTIFCSCEVINEKIGVKNDNLAEEIIEEVIEYQSGADIDLTPASAE